MSISYCPEGALLLQNIAEAMRRQCELPAKSKSIEEIAREMDTAEAVQAANRHAADHLMACPICRTTSPIPGRPLPPQPPSIERTGRPGPFNPTKAKLNPSKQAKNHMSSPDHAKARSPRGF
jgi:hypothetical protein